jgi:hypothetical protein
MDLNVYTFRSEQWKMENGDFQCFRTFDKSMRS